MGGLVTRTGGLSRRAAYPLSIRRQVLDRLQQAGPAWIQGNLRGAGRRWYSSKLTICMITCTLSAANGAGSVGAVADCGAIFPSNWAAALILLGTAPLIRCLWCWLEWGLPMLTDVTFSSCSLKWAFPRSPARHGNIAFFGRGEAEIESIRSASEDFRNGQWKCYDWRFYPPAFSNFFLAVNCSGGGLLWFFLSRRADFGHYDTGVTLAAGFLALILRQSFSSHYAISVRFIMLKPSCWCS